MYDRAGLSAVTAEGCEAPGDRLVNCRLDAAGVRVVLGDGDDEFSPGTDYPAGHGVVVDGGAGNDTITGGAGSDTLDGGDGNDSVDGRGGADVVRGGAGDDHLMGDHFESAAPDVIDGGPGVDTLQDDYVESTDGSAPDVTLTLAGGADDGRPGEGDDVRGVEDVVVNQGGALAGTDAPEHLKAFQTVRAVRISGGGGDDVLEGGGGADTVDGGPGDDTIDAGYGDDTITGGPGRDRIFADRQGGDCGPLWCTSPYGNDTVEARDGEVDTIDCGLGQDTVHADAFDIVSSDCETVDRGGTVPGPQPASPSGTGDTPTTGATCVVPRVTGLRAATARRRVAAAGCRARVRGHGPRVRRQSVRAGRRVPRATVVRLTLGD